MATTSPYLRPDFLFHSALPSLKFQIPNSTQENQQPILSPSLSNLHIRLYGNTTHHVLNATDPNLDFRVTETHYQSRVYLHNQPIEQGLVNVLSNWQIPETHHEYIIRSTLMQLDTVERYYDPLPTPFLFQVDVSCDKYYRPDMSIFSQEDYEDDDYYDYWIPQYDDEIDERMIPASESAIKSLVVKEKRDEIEGSSSSCPICLEEFLEGSVTGCMPCSHLFHQECITNWLRRSHYCPLCRFQMPTTMSK